MSIPTPSAIAKQATERKQRELQRQVEIEAQIKALEEKLSKESDAKHKRTASKNGWKSGSSKKRPSSPSPSSEKAPERPATSSKSEESSPKPAVVKKPFVRKPHLTQRLTDNEKLLELKASMPVVKHVNRAPSSKKSGTSTSSQKQRTKGATSSSQSSQRKSTSKRS